MFDSIIRMIESKDFPSRLVVYELIKRGDLAFSEDQLCGLVLRLSRKMHNADFNGTVEYMKIIEVLKVLMKQ